MTHTPNHTTQPHAKAMENYVKTNLKLTDFKFSVPIPVDQKDALVDYFVALRIPFNVTSEDIEICNKINMIDFLGKIFKDSDGELLDAVSALGVPTVNDLIKVYVVNENAVIPSKAHASDIGYDLVIIDKIKDLTSNTALYETGIKMIPPPGYYLEIHPRSSISKTGYMLANSTGIIDPGYTGNLLVALTKIDPAGPDLELPAKIVQVIVRQAYVSGLSVEAVWEQTARNAGGFGSTN